MEKSVCGECDFARMRRDICGTYCTGGFENADGTCKYFKSYYEAKKERAQKAYAHKKKRSKPLTERED